MIHLKIENKDRFKIEIVNLLQTMTKGKEKSKNQK